VTRAPRGGGPGGGGAAHDDGVALSELVVAGALVLLAIGICLPTVTRALDATRGRHAAGFVASHLRRARQQAALRALSVGVLFDRNATGQWELRVCQDGNGNGVRRSDVAVGVDPCPDGPMALTVVLPGADLAVEPGIDDPDGGPAGTDPVRFGSSDLASFSPAGTCTAGTLFVRTSGGVQFAVRVAGATGRTRILRYEPGSRRWGPA